MITTSFPADLEHVAGLPPLKLFRMCLDVWVSTGLPAARVYQTDWQDNGVLTSEGQCLYHIKKLHGGLSFVSKITGVLNTSSKGSLGRTVALQAHFDSHMYWAEGQSLRLHTYSPRWEGTFEFALGGSSGTLASIQAAVAENNALRS